MMDWHGTARLILLVEGLEDSVPLEEDVTLEPPGCSLGDLVVGKLGSRDL